MKSELTDGGIACGGQTFHPLTNCLMQLSS